MALKPESPSVAVLKTATLEVLSYCRRNAWAGFDPYDALNSRLFERSPFFRSRCARLAFTQLMKRSPVNLRGLLGIPRTQNPKALALFLMSLIRLERQGLLEDRGLISTLVDRLRDLRSPGLSYWCWGYSFPWQTRTVLVPRGHPNIVCTVFVGKALLEARDLAIPGSAACAEMSRSAADYILRELYWTDGPAEAGFAYPVPEERRHIYNADLLGAALLSRVSRLTQDPRYAEAALRVARWAVRQQHESGAWPYGEGEAQRWIDNFHTGYNLSALAELDAIGEPGEFAAPLRKGFAFYRESFFREGGPPRYYADRTYPIDIHCIAQSILTLVDLKNLDGSNLDLAESLARWALAHMRSHRGAFYYRAYPLMKNRISYMRWSQAWMLLALSSLLGERGARSASGQDLLPGVERLGVA